MSNKDKVLLDADIREPLFDYLEQYYGKVRFLEEKVTGKARADAGCTVGGALMKKYFELGNRYAAESDWKDFALTKLCACSIGVMIGACIPAGGKKKAIAAAGGVFAVTYVPLMKKVFGIAKEMIEEQK